MSLSPGRRNETPHHQSLKFKTLLSPLGFFYRAWISSLRISYTSKDGLTEINNLAEPLTIVLWHNRLFLAGEWHRRFRKSRKCYGLISGSRDGGWLETFYGWAGILAIRGSENRRGARAARELIRVIRDGYDVGITPDGSRGPKYQAKAGALLVAKASRSPVALLSFSFSWAIRLKSWDGFIIPFPFSKVYARTRILAYEELFKDQDLKQATKKVEQGLMEMTDDRV